MEQPKTRYLQDAPKDDWYVLEDPVSFRWKDIGFVRIPAGYVSDGCSVPKLLQGIFPPKDAYFVPGLVHDYLYEKKEAWINRPIEAVSVYKYLVTRKDADDLFLVLLNHFAPNTRIRNYIRYLTVRIRGKSWWDNARYVDIRNYKL